MPLQSGSDRILRRMRRNYDSTFYRQVLDRLARAMPDIGLGADVIVGFPGETEEDFLATEELIRTSPLSYLHVFSYSARPGTDAAEQAGRVDPRDMRRRVARLRRLAADKGRAFRRRFVGRTLTAVTLEDPAGDGRVRALTGNFFEVLLPAGAVPGNRLLEVKVTGSGDTVATGHAA